MTETLMNGAAHLEDGELLRYLDGESEHGERGAAEQHLAACEDCRARLRGLERRSDAVSAALRSADVTPPPVRLVNVRRSRSAWWRGPQLKAAAVLVALLGGALTVSPVRAWLVDRWHDVRSAFSDADAPGPDSDPSDQLQGAGSVAFVPAAGSFTVRLSARQPTGTLRAVTSADSVASARVLGVASGIDLVVLPDGLVIRNDSTAAASYELRLPRGVTELVVEMAGRAAVRVGAGELMGTGWSIELGR
jgi:predicted anti-sigma-YlaC factor YlaD